MNIAIIDDMLTEIDEVKNLLNEYAAVNHTEINISIFPSAESFLAVYRPLVYTIIFMDIYMSDILPHL